MAVGRKDGFVGIEEVEGMVWSVVINKDTWGYENLKSLGGSIMNLCHVFDRRMVDGSFGQKLSKALVVRGIFCLC